MSRTWYLFTLADIPVRVSLWYGLLVILWLRGEDMAGSMIWIGVVTVSILVHEFGHGLVARHYRLRPQILLHGLGGLCFHDHAERDRHDVFIIVAGPGAGLLLGAATWVFALAAGDSTWTADGGWIQEVVSASLYVNIGWSLVNLLPIYPLDGGQLFRLGMLRLVRPLLADRITHGVSLGILALALYLFGGSGLLLLLVLWIGWANVQGLRGNAAMRPIRYTSQYAKKLLASAEAAYCADDFREAARLCHVARKQENVADNVTRKLWAILGVSEARLGRHRDAISFLQRAPASVEVTEARVECFHALGLDDELDALLASRDFRKITAARRQEILEVVRPDPPG